MNTRSNSSTNNIFMNNNNNQSPSNNIFSSNNTNTNNTNNSKPHVGNIFSNNNQSNSNGTNNIFSNRSPATSNGTNNNIFNNNQSNQSNQNNNNNQNNTNNIFTNNSQNTNNSNNLFNNNTQNRNGSSNIFTSNNQGNSNNQNNNLFTSNSNQNTSNNNIFNNQNGNNSNNNNNNQGNNLFNNNANNQGNASRSFNGLGNSNNNEAYGMHIISNSNINGYSLEEQNIIFNLFSLDYIRQTINHCRKSLDIKKFDFLALSQDNFLRKEKTSKIAQEFNIKKQLILVKKELKTKLLDPIKELKNKQKQIQNLSQNFTGKVLDKLQVYKTRLIESISTKKMIAIIQEQIDEIQVEIKDFLTPISQAFQKDKSPSFNFVDPNEFCLKISKKLLNNMTKLDVKMDELLACEEETQDTIDTSEVIEQLIEYYQNVAITMKDFCDRYSKAKEKAFKRNYFSKKMSEKACVKVNKELQAYELIKQIQGLLEQRDKQTRQSNKF